MTIDQILKEAREHREERNKYEYMYVKDKDEAKRIQENQGVDMDISEKDHGEHPYKVKEVLSTWPYHVIEEVEYEKEDWSWLINYQD